MAVVALRLHADLWSNPKPKGLSSVPEQEQDSGSGHWRKNHRSGTGGDDI